MNAPVLNKYELLFDSRFKQWQGVTHDETVPEIHLTVKALNCSEIFKKES